MNAIWWYTLNNNVYTLKYKLYVCVTWMHIPYKKILWFWNVIEWIYLCKWTSVTLYMNCMEMLQNVFTSILKLLYLLLEVYRTIIWCLYLIWTLFFMNLHMNSFSYLKILVYNSCISYMNTSTLKMKYKGLGTYTFIHEQL